MKNDLIEIIDPLQYYTTKDLCGDCKYKQTFLCDKKYAEGIKKHYLGQYNVKLYVYQFKTNNLMKIVEYIHKKEVFHHRNGSYFALQATNHHCGYYCDCDCPDKTRCWTVKIKSRQQPHCIKFFGIDLPDKYKQDNIAFVLGNLEFDEIKKV